MGVCHKFQGAHGHIRAKTGHPTFEHMLKIHMNGNEIIPKLQVR